MPPRRIQDRTATAADVPDPALVAEATAFFVPSIRDPFNPRHCGKCLDGALHECTLDEQKDLQTEQTIKPKKELKYNPVLWNAIAAFLFLKRTDQQIKKLMTRLSDCKCGTNLSLVRRSQAQESIWRYHDIGKTTVNPAMARTSMDRDEDFEEEEFNPTKTFGVYSCAFIVNLFTILIIPVGQSSTRSAAKGSSSSWPVHLTNLIPYGADDFVQSMLQWYRFVPDTIIFNLTALVLRACKLLIVPSLIKFNFFTAVVDSTRTMIDRTMAELDTNKYPFPDTPTKNKP